MTFVLYNNTDQDYDEVGIRLAFGQVNGKIPTLLQSSIQTPRDAYDDVPLSTTSPTDGGLRLAYNLHIANRSNHGIFLATYIFEGDKVPELTVILQKKGLDAVELDPTVLHADKVPLTFSNISFVCLVIVLVVALLVFHSKGYRLVIHDKEDREAIASVLSKISDRKSSLSAKM